MEFVDRTRRLTLAAGLAAGLVAAAWTAPAQAQEKVVMGLPSAWNVQFSFPVFGEKLGFFREEGIELERVAVTGSAVLIPQIAAGQVQFGYANPDLMIIALARGEPLPLRFVMNWLRTQTFEFVVLENSPVRTLADLKGRKLGVGALTWGNLPLSRAMLASQGVNWQRDVEVLPVGLGAAAWRRLQTGEVDALNLFVGEHERMAIAGVPFRRVPMPDPFGAFFSNGWVTSEDMIARRPQVVEGFGRALVKSWIACRANPEACVRAWWEANPTSRPAAGQEAQQLATDLRLVGVDHRQVEAFPAGGPRVWGQFPEGAWKQLIDVMHAEGQIPRADLDVSRLFTDAFLQGINRIDVAAVEAAARAAR
jgi:NitT/TauT family transport system substrate-binding protein